MKAAYLSDDELTSLAEDGDLTGWERLYELRARRKEIGKVVVLVHGTFAAKPSDIGDAWWQKSGEIPQEFQHDDSVFVLAFSWSGRNSAHARRMAGLRLWVLLQQIETLQVPYVVLAHSHGGMVTWNALRMSSAWGNADKFPRRKLGFAFLRRAGLSLPIADLQSPTIPSPGDQRLCQLPNLKRWITVGTPFLIEGFGYKSLTYVILFLTIGLVTLYSAGTVSPEWTKEGSLAHGAAIIFLGLSLVIFVAFVVRGLRKSVEANLHARSDDAKQLFQSRHTPIWSCHDEAINALRMAKSGFSPLVPRFRAFSADAPREIRHWSRAEQFLRYSNIKLFRFAQRFLRSLVRIPIQLIGFLGNVFVLSFVDKIVWSRFSRGAFGMDVGGMRVNSVVPFLGPALQHRPIEESHAVEIVDFVNANDPQLVSMARTLLYESSVVGLSGMEKSKADALSTHLVHNSYFACDETRSLISDAVNAAFAEGQRPPNS